MENLKTMVRMFISVVFTFTLCSTSVFAETFYVDPIHGSSLGDGSSTAPFKTLQSVIEQGVISTRDWNTDNFTTESRLIPKNADGVIHAGDTIVLLSGYHGELKIQGAYNADWITIKAAAGHLPQVRRINIQAASKWRISGLKVMPFDVLEDCAKMGILHQDLVSVRNSETIGAVHHIDLEHLAVSSVEATEQRAPYFRDMYSCNGMMLQGEHVNANRNTIAQVYDGIVGRYRNVNISNNYVHDFSGDGLRVLSSFVKLEYNYVAQCHNVDETHNDGIQGFAFDPASTGDDGLLRNVTIKGNMVVNWLDVDSPTSCKMQGIVGWDGRYQNWRIENNVVAVSHYHGISFSGLQQSQIVNNSVIHVWQDHVERPGIRVTESRNDHINQGNLVSYNIADEYQLIEGVNAYRNLTAQDMNAVGSIETIFKNPLEYDFRLSTDAEVFNAEALVFSPEIDILGQTRRLNSTVDCGAYERPEVNDSNHVMFAAGLPEIEQRYGARSFIQFDGLRVDGAIDSMPMDTPETPMDTPDTPMDTPETPMDTPDTPDTPMDTPDTPMDTPDTPMDTPDTPMDTPDTPMDTPDTPMDTPDTPMDTPDAPMDTPDIITDDMNDNSDDDSYVHITDEEELALKRERERQSSAQFEKDEKMPMAGCSSSSNTGDSSIYYTFGLLLTLLGFRRKKN